MKTYYHASPKELPIGEMLKTDRFFDRYDGGEWGVLYIGNLVFFTDDIVVHETMSSEYPSFNVYSVTPMGKVCYDQNAKTHFSADPVTIGSLVATVEVTLKRGDNGQCILEQEIRYI